jgi:hypothetical protein
MGSNVIELFSLDNLRRRAERLSAASGAALPSAMDEVARRMGHGDWAAMARSAGTSVVARRAPAPRFLRKLSMDPAPPSARPAAAPVLPMAKRDDEVWAAFVARGQIALCWESIKWAVQRNKPDDLAFNKSKQAEAALETFRKTYPAGRPFDAKKVSETIERVVAAEFAAWPARMPAYRKCPFAVHQASEEALKQASYAACAATTVPAETRVRAATMVLRCFYTRSLRVNGIRGHESFEEYARGLLGHASGFLRREHPDLHALLVGTYGTGPSRIEDGFSHKRKA